MGETMAGRAAAVEREEELALYRSEFFRGGSPPVPLHAQQFSAPVRAASGVYFGLNKENVAERLRRLADDIEKGDVLLQEVHVKTVATHDDWLFSHVTLVVVEGEKLKL